MAHGKVDFFNDTGGYGFIDTDDADKLKKEFIGLTDDSQAKEKMAPAEIDGFIAADDEKYDIIRKYKED